MTSEQTALLKKAQDSLTAARLLYDHGLYGFSASRAYYTMFYIAEAMLLNEGLRFSKHSAVIAAFGRQIAKTGKVAAEFHRYLIEGESDRAIGDYSASASLDKEQAEEEIARAEAFIELGQQYLKSDDEERDSTTDT